MNLSDYISEKWKNSNEYTQTSWVAHSTFTHSQWQDLCKPEKKIPTPLPVHIAYKTIVSFFLLWKVSAFSLCPCVSLTHTHIHLRDFMCDLFFSAWDYGYFSLLFWWWCSELNPQIHFNRLEKIKASSLHLFFWNLWLYTFYVHTHDC